MCSFLVLNKKLYNSKTLQELNELLKSRGPDNTNVFEYSEYVFIHNLLYFCGVPTLQPIVKDNIILLFNGEIYNYLEFGNYSCDSECIIDLYLKYSIDFVKYLDGEFAISIFDFNKNCVILSSDTFGTKPLFYGYSNGFVISSIKKTIIDNELINNEVITKLMPNTCIKLNMNNKIIETTETCKFYLNQFKTSYDDFNKALEESIIKRCSLNNKENNEVFITLSSGYDSGVIDLILKNNKIKYSSYTIEAKENLDILNKRIENLDILNKRIENNKKIENNNTLIKLSCNEYTESENYVKNNCDNYNCIYFEFDKNNDNNNDVLDKYSKETRVYSAVNDWGAYGLNHIFKLANNSGKRIYISGHGPDEIMSDYGYSGEAYNKCSEIKGIFPDNLEEIYPWINFYRGTMQTFIAKEESVSSLHGIESRYPFLDKKVIQEFLWLKPELKNKKYKAPLHYYMEKYNYPFCENEKIGFKCKKHLIDTELNTIKCSYYFKLWNKGQILFDIKKFLSNSKFEIKLSNLFKGN